MWFLSPNVTLTDIVLSLHEMLLALFSDSDELYGYMIAYHLLKQFSFNTLYLAREQEKDTLHY